MKYPLASSSWGHEEIDAIQQVIASDRYTMGEHVSAFEKAFANYFGSQHALMVSSGSAANLVGIAALAHKKDHPLQRGDEVIVPAISWATTYYPLQQYGLKLKFVDVELDTLNIDINQLEKALTTKTRMVVAVSILGNPCALDTLRKFCDQHELILFEDNCESMGATLNGKQCGTFGDIGTFSSFFSHHIATMEGGMIVTDSRELYDICKAMRAHGWTRDLADDSDIYDKSDDELFEAYKFILPGYNARPVEMSGAIGLQQLKKLDQMINVRRDNGRLFTKLFANDKRFIIPKENGHSSWFCFPVILNPQLDINRRDIFNALKKAGIEHRIVTGGNFLRHPVIRYFDYEVIGEVNNANIVHDRGFFVGNHPRDLSEELHYFHRVLTDTIDNYAGSNHLSRRIGNPA